MRKCITFLIITIFAVIGCNAQNFSYDYNGVTFKGKINKGIATIKSFNFDALNVTIPSTIVFNGTPFPVKSVGVFMNGVNYSAINIEIEEGIETIENFCFNEFRKLTKIILPHSIKMIGNNALRNNPGLSISMDSSIDEFSLRKGKVVLGSNSGVRNSPNEYLFADNKKGNEQSKPKNKNAFIATKNEQQSVSDSQLTHQSIPQSIHQPEPKLASQPNQPSNLPLVDVDVNIPTSNTVNSNTYCIIIANEKYRDVADVDFAERDGNIFKEYCLKTLGIPEKQIRSFINASYTDIKRALSWIETMDEISQGDSKVIFYYAGHGIPNEQDKTAYLIPADGFPKDVTTCFKLSDLYCRLGNLKSKSVTVLLDACFSGVNRGSGQALVAARGVAIKPRDEVLKGNLIVISATSNEETALAYNDKRHGMFTYFLLDYLKKTNGNGSFGDMFKDIHMQVKKNSMLENDKLQTPSINVSTNMKNSWETLRF